MVICVPMAGTGDRYRRAGFVEPKPLIPVNGAPMIERVLEGFPAGAKYVFGVNRDHLDTSNLEQVLRRLRPRAALAIVEPHKDGPVRTLADCAPFIPDEEPVVVNYCDYGSDLDFCAFERWLQSSGNEGAMTAYRGFHPHSLGPTLYAYMRSEGDRVLEVREKHHFTDDKLSEYASSGLYYFRTGALLKRACEALRASGARVNGEQYASMLMQVLIDWGLPVGVFPLAHFYQWGTPEDLRDYAGWAAAMAGVDALLSQAARSRARSPLLMPMAGLGARFAGKGYHRPKPLIGVAGTPMAALSEAFLPRAAERCLVVREELATDPDFAAMGAEVGDVRTRVVRVQRTTEGQAATARLGAQEMSPGGPVLIAPCDAGYAYDIDRWLDIESRTTADLVVFVARNHLPAVWRPQMYGWAHTEGERVVSIAVKAQVQGVAAADQAALTGTFWFRSVRRFLLEERSLRHDDERVNGELYIDTIARRMAARGADVRAFFVDKWMPWGTPEELQTFLYWNDVMRSGRPLLP